MKFALVLLLLAAPGLIAQARGQNAPETGDFTIHMILHAIGSEHYSIEHTNQGLLLKTTVEYTGALHKAGVPIVAGSDTGLVGFGLLRELELYVKAELTPMEATQTARIVPARAMGLDKDTGTVEAGKRADLILVDGDPLTNISDLRKVTTIITKGRMYDTATLWRSVGFKP